MDLYTAVSLSTFLRYMTAVINLYDKTVCIMKYVHINDSFMSFSKLFGHLKAQYY